MSFLESFTFAYNTTITSTPGLGWLYEQIPGLTNEEAFRQGLMRLKTVFTLIKNLDPPKSVSFVREIVRASPTILYPIIEKNCPELHKILNPRGGKVPREYLGKLFARDVDAIGKKLAGQIMREVEKALPKLARALLGLDGEAAKLIGENVLKKSGTIIAKSPEVEWAWIAGWIGLVIGSVAYASMDQIGINQSIQGGMQVFFRYWYGTDQVDASTDQMTVVLLRKKLQIIHNTAFGQANLMGIEVPQTTVTLMKSLVLQLDAAEKKV